MDPVTIISTTTTVIRLCATISGYVFTFVTNARNVDTAITTLGVEVNSLSQVLNAITDSLNDNTLANAAFASQTGHEAQHWTNVQQSMEDCKRTLESLIGVLENVRRNSSSRGLFGRARSQFKIEISSAQIMFLKQQIAAYRQTMQLSLHSSVLSGNETLLANQISGFDGLRIEVRRLARLFRSQNQAPADQTSTAVVRNLQQCVQSAEQFVHHFRLPNDNTQWFRNLPASTIDENVDYNTFATSSTSFSEIDAFTDDTITVYHEAQRRQSIGSGITEEPLEGPDPEIAKHLIQYWKKSAKSHFDAGEYVTAERYLQRVIERSEALEGQQFQGRSETLQLLVLSLSRQKKWNEADLLLQQTFIGREEIMEQIAAIGREQGDWDPARKILMELWDHPAEARDHNARSRQRVRLRQAIAEVYFGMKDYANAEQWCHRAVGERKAMVGMKDPLFYESVCLLCRIYRLMGDTVEAEAYQVLLPPGYVEVEELCRMTPKEAAAQIGMQILRELPRQSAFGLWTLDQIKDSIRVQARGVVGSLLIIVFVEMGLQWPIQLLLEKGTDIETKDGHGWNALSMAATAGKDDVARLLLKNGSNVNAQDIYGWSALMKAATRGNISMVRLLVENGANTNLKVSDGPRTIDLAKDPEVRKYLESI